MTDLPAPAATVEPPAASALAGSTGDTRPLARGTAFYPRKRAVKACQVCRARRTKCDNAKPSCSFCLKVGATCIQSPVDLSSFDPASLKILERLDDLEELLRSVSLEGEATVSKTRVVEASRGFRRDALHEPVTLKDIVPQGPEHIASWPVFAAFQDEPERVQALKSALHRGPVLGAPDMEPRRINELLDNFFSYVHVKNPVLDETATRNTVLSSVVNGLDWSSESCLTLLVCALGSIATPFGPSLNTMPGTSAHNNAQSYFTAAQHRIGMALCGDDTLGAQCLFLSGVYMMCTFQPVRAWRFFLQALATCQQFSFLQPPSQEHRPASSDHQVSPSPPAEERDAGSPHYTLDTLQQAIYWSSWKSEREVRGGDTVHRPSDFSPPHRDHHLGLYPPFFPTPPAPRPETAGAPVNSRLARERTSWYFYLAEISLRRLAARVTAEMVGLRDDSAAQGQTRAYFLAELAKAVPGYEEQVREWVTSLPTCLSFEAPAEEDDVCRFVLRGHLINLFELIYWPFLAAYLDCLEAQDSQLMPENTVRLAQKALDHHFIRLRINRPGYKHRHHGTIPLILSCSRSALTLVAATKLLQGRAGQAHGGEMSDLCVPEGWAAEVDEVIDLLAFWGFETQEFRYIHRVLEQAHASMRAPTCFLS